MRFLSQRIVGILLFSIFQPLITGVGYAQGVAQEQEEQTLQKVDVVETFVERIADVVEDKVKNEELLERFEEKKEEMHEEIKEQREKIKETTSSTEQEEAVIELKKTVYLKTYSGLTDHDEIDEIVQVEGGQAEQERAQETALESMQTEEIGEDPSYTVMLKTKLSQEQIEKKLAPFIQESQQLQIEQLFEEDGVVFFELQVDQESLLGEELLGEVQEGDIPDHLLGIEVIKPEVMEIGQVDVPGLAGESVDKLRGMQQYGSAGYQSALSGRKKVSVGVVDTGIDYTHPDLRSQMHPDIKGYDFVNRDDDPMDDHLHGTHVAGTIGAALNGKGVYGVNTHVQLVPLKICNKYGYCPSYAIYNAVKYAADYNIDVLNMSLGGRGNVRNNSTCQAIDYAIRKGSLVISAAGNANRPADQYIPGACPGAITVGAVDASKKRARFSNYGPRVDIAAPGVGIYSTIPGATYKHLDGTSMATPHVAGLASVINAIKPDITQQQIKLMLQNNSISVTNEPGKTVGQFVSMEKVMAGLGVGSGDTGCSAGEHLSEGGCVSSTRTCEGTNGSGTSSWGGESRGSCVLNTCISGYELRNGVCIEKKANPLEVTVQGIDSEKTTLATNNDRTEITMGIGQSISIALQGGQPAYKVSSSKKDAVALMLRESTRTASTEEELILEDGGEELTEEETFALEAETIGVDENGNEVEESSIEILEEKEEDETETDDELFIENVVAPEETTPTLEDEITSLFASGSASSETMIASAGAGYQIDVLGLKEGRTTLTVTDKKGQVRYIDIKIEPATLYVTYRKRYTLKPDTTQSFYPHYFRSYNRRTTYIRGYGRYYSSSRYIKLYGRSVGKTKVRLGFWNPSSRKRYYATADLETTKTYYAKPTFSREAKPSKKITTLFNGTEKGTVKYVDGKFGKAYSSDSNKGNYITMGSAIGKEMSGNMTISMWIKPNNLNSRKNPLAKAYGGEGTITQERNGAMSFYYGTSGRNRHSYMGIHSSTPVKVNERNHVTIVRNFDTNHATRYVNGRKNSRKLYRHLPYARPGGYDMLLGKGYVDDYDGGIDEVRMYNRALSDHEVADLRKNTTPSTQGLIGYRSFDDETSKDEKKNAGGKVYFEDVGEQATATNGPLVLDFDNLSTAPKELELSVGELDHFFIKGGRPGYRVRRDRYRRVFTYVESNVEIASDSGSGSSSLIVVEGSDEHLAELEDLDTIPVPDIPEELLVSEEESETEELVIDDPMSEEFVSTYTGESIDVEDSFSLAESSDEGVDIAEVGYKVNLLGTQPGTSTITVYDRYRKSHTIKVTIKPTTLHLQYGKRYYVSINNNQEVTPHMYFSYNSRIAYMRRYRSWRTRNYYNFLRGRSPGQTRGQILLYIPKIGAYTRIYPNVSVSRTSYRVPTRSAGLGTQKDKKRAQTRTLSEISVPVGETITNVYMGDIKGPYTGLKSTNYARVKASGHTLQIQGSVPGKTSLTFTDVKGVITTLPIQVTTGTEGQRGACGSYSNVCDETGIQKRTVMSRSCTSSGTCKKNTKTETQACSRQIGAGCCLSTSECGAEVVSDRGSCTGFDNVCDTSGTQKRTVTTPLCSNNQCKTTTRTETQVCSRSVAEGCCMSADECGQEKVTERSACVGFTDVCDGTGIQTRTKTVPTCQDNQCGQETETERQSCTRPIAKDCCVTSSDCPSSTSSAWGSCSGYANECATDGTQTRTTTAHSCVQNICTAKKTTQTQSCERAEPEVCRAVEQMRNRTHEGEDRSFDRTGIIDPTTNENRLQIDRRRIKIKVGQSLKRVMTGGVKTINVAPKRGKNAYIYRTSRDDIAVHNARQFRGGETIGPASVSIASEGGVLTEDLEELPEGVSLSSVELLPEEKIDNEDTEIASADGSTEKAFWIYGLVPGESELDIWNSAGNFEIPVIVEERVEELYVGEYVRLQGYDFYQIKGVNVSGDKHIKLYRHGNDIVMKSLKTGTSSLDLEIYIPEVKQNVRMKIKVTTPDSKIDWKKWIDANGQNKPVEVLLGSQRLVHTTFREMRQTYSSDPTVIEVRTTTYGPSVMIARKAGTANVCVRYYDRSKRQQIAECTAYEVVTKKSNSAPDITLHVGDTMMLRDPDEDSLGGVRYRTSRGIAIKSPEIMSASSRRHPPITYTALQPGITELCYTLQERKSRYRNDTYQCHKVEVLRSAGSIPSAQQKKINWTSTPTKTTIVAPVRLTTYEGTYLTLPREGAPYYVKIGDTDLVKGGLSNADTKIASIDSVDDIHRDDASGSGVVVGTGAGGDRSYTDPFAGNEASDTMIASNPVVFELLAYKHGLTDVKIMNKDHEVIQVPLLVDKKFLDFSRKKAPLKDSTVTGVGGTRAVHQFVEQYPDGGTDSKRTCISSTLKSAGWNKFTSALEVKCNGYHSVIHYFGGLPQKTFALGVGQKKAKHYGIPSSVQITQQGQIISIPVTNDPGDITILPLGEKGMLLPVGSTKQGSTTNYYFLATVPGHVAVSLESPSSYQYDLIPIRIDQPVILENRTITMPTPPSGMNITYRSSDDNYLMISGRTWKPLRTGDVEVEVTVTDVTNKTTTHTINVQIADDPTYTPTALVHEKNTQTKIDKSTERIEKGSYVMKQGERMRVNLWDGAGPYTVELIEKGRVVHAAGDTAFHIISQNDAVDIASADSRDDNGIASEEAPKDMLELRFESQKVEEIQSQKEEEGVGIASVPTYTFDVFAYGVGQRTLRITDKKGRTIEKGLVIGRTDVDVKLGDRIFLEDQIGYLMDTKLRTYSTAHVEENVIEYKDRSKKDLTRYRAVKVGSFEATYDVVFPDGRRVQAVRRYGVNGDQKYFDAKEANCGVGLIYHNGSCVINKNHPGYKEEEKKAEEEKKEEVTCPSGYEKEGEKCVVEEREEGGSVVAPKIFINRSEINIGSFFDVEISGGDGKEILGYDSNYIACKQEGVGIASHEGEIEGDEDVLKYFGYEGNEKTKVQSADLRRYRCLAHKAGKIVLSVEKRGLGVANAVPSIELEIYDLAAFYPTKMVLFLLPSRLNTISMESNKPECLVAMVNEKNYFHWNPHKLCDGVVVSWEVEINKNGIKRNIAIDMRLEDKGIKEVTPTVLKKNLEHRFFFSKASNFKVYYDKTQLSLSDKGKAMMKTGSGPSPEGCGSDVSKSIGTVTQIPIKLLVGDAYICIENVDTKEIQKMHIISESSNSGNICVNDASNQCMNIPGGHIFYQQVLANEGFANGSITPYTPTVGEKVKNFVHGGKMYRVRVMDGYKDDVMYVLDEIEEGAIYGDYVEDPNGYNMIGQIGGGFTPAGRAGDVRDLRYQWNDGSNFGIGMAVVGFVPLVGDGAKVATKGTKIGKAGDELGEIIKALPYIYLDVGSSVGVKTYTQGVSELLNNNKIRNTLDNISTNTKARDRDGIPFYNKESLLPQKGDGYYTERTVETPGLSSRGAKRIVSGKNGEKFYTDDHYKSFIRIK